VRARAIVAGTIAFAALAQPARAASADPCPAGLVPAAEQPRRGRCVQVTPPDTHPPPAAQVPLAQTPVTPQTPKATQTPVPIQIPTTTEAPATAQAPAATEAPTATQIPAPVQIPTPTQEPATTRAPATTQAPTAMQTPPPIQVPTPTQEPATAQAPATARAPATAQAPPATTQAPAAQAPASTPPPAPGQPTASTQTSAVTPTPTATSATQPPVAVATPPPAIPPPVAPRPAPTEEELAEATRALERSLVQQGGLTLDAGTFELVPEVTYSFSEGNALLRTGGGEVNVGTRSEIYAGALTLRVGLPFRFQAEVTAPFIWSRWTGLTGNAEDPASTGSGFGDVTVAGTWQLLRAYRNFPDVLVSGFWKARNGESALDDPDVLVPVGNGIETYGGSLSILKALDPVVLLASGSWTHAEPRWAPFGWLDAGDEYGASASAVLAVSPETSFSLGLDLSYAQLIRVDEVPLPNSDRTSAMFRVGISTLASRHGMLEVNLGIGLTREVPRFEVNVATPLQF
jgi:hypothetical protein